MSDVVKRPYDEMQLAAVSLLGLLEPACKRIRIAGSLRRREAMIGDIELVCVPEFYQDLLGQDIPGDYRLNQVLKHLDVAYTKNGDHFKQFTVVIADKLYRCDLFIQPDPETWGVNFLIRTGNSDFSHWMVTPKSWGGAMPVTYKVSQGRVWDRGNAVRTPEERDIFELWGMEWIPPEERHR